LDVVFFLRVGFFAFVPGPVALVTVFALLFVPADFLAVDVVVGAAAAVDSPAVVVTFTVDFVVEITKADLGKR